MTWQDYLTDKERSELSKAEAKRDAAREQYNATRIKLKKRAEGRKGRAKDAEAKD